MRKAYDVELVKVSSDKKDLSYRCPHCDNEFNETGEIPASAEYIRNCPQCNHKFIIAYNFQK